MELTTRVSSMVPDVPAEQRVLFAELVEQHRGLVCGVAYSAIGDKAMSEEIAQEAFLTAWKKLPELTEPSRLPSWLCGIARHLALNARRKTVREVASEDIPDIASSAPTPFENLASKESRQLVWQALEDIPDNDKSDTRNGDPSSWPNETILPSLSNRGHDESETQPRCALLAGRGAAVIGHRGRLRSYEKRPANHCSGEGPQRDRH